MRCAPAQGCPTGLCSRIQRGLRGSRLDDDRWRKKPRQRCIELRTEPVYANAAEPGHKAMSEVAQPGTLKWLTRWMCRAGTWIPLGSADSSCVQTQGL